MFKSRNRFRSRLLKVIQTFREKDATSPEGALSLQELDLPPQFRRFTNGHLNQSGLFVEVNGKYYLEETRAREFEDTASTRQHTEHNRDIVRPRLTSRSEKSAVQAEGLTKKFGDFTAVDHISFSVEQGEILGFLGPNGAGKTTTINMLCTLMTPTEGGATVAGFDVVKDADEVRRRIGVVTEKLIVYDRLTPIENLKLFGRLYDVSGQELETRVEELLKLIDLWEWRDRQVGNFSSGMRQRLNVIRALIHSPDILFLDEPTVGLDPATALNIRELIAKLNQSGKTIILTTHQMEVAEKLCHRVSIIDHGQIIALETLENLKAKVGPDTTLEEVFIKLTGSRMRDAPKKNRFFTAPSRWGRRHF